jgi:hypothetical protein
MANDCSISYFKQQIKSISNVNRYRITINNKYFQEFSGYSVYASSITQPGQSFNITKFQIQGLTIAAPMSLDYDPVKITFVCDSKLKPWKAVNKWMDELIFDKKNLEMAFVDDIKTNIYIELLNRKNENVLKIKLKGAWPKDISDIELGYGKHENIHEFTTSFLYKSWEVID